MRCVGRRSCVSTLDETDGWSSQVESMRHVHLHVISSDMLSPKLKNKKCVPSVDARCI